MALSELLARWMPKEPQEETETTDSEPPLVLQRLQTLVQADAANPDKSEQSDGSESSPIEVSDLGKEIETTEAWVGISFEGRG